MRILAFFLRLLVFSAIIGVFVYFFGGTIWLKVGSYGFSQDITQLTLYDKNIATYNKICQTSPGSSENSVPLSFQLRFIDDRQYALEVVCTLIENTPIEIKRAS